MKKKHIWFKYIKVDGSRLKVLFNDIIPSSFDAPVYPLLLPELLSVCEDTIFTVQNSLDYHSVNVLIQDFL